MLSKHTKCGIVAEHHFDQSGRSHFLLDQPSELSGAGHVGWPAQGLGPPSRTQEPVTSDHTPAAAAAGFMRDVCCQAAARLLCATA
jgi:hypothetical protein